LQPVRAPTSDEFCSALRLPFSVEIAGTGTHAVAPGAPSAGRSTVYRGTVCQAAEIRALTSQTFERTPKDSVAWVRERTIPTERPPFVGEVGTIFYT
jgi:hypothetical protein